MKLFTDIKNRHFVNVASRYCGDAKVLFWMLEGFDNFPREL